MAGDYTVPEPAATRGGPNGDRTQNLLIEGSNVSEPRGDVDLVGHNVIVLPDRNIGPLPPIDNIIIRSTKPETRWLQEATMAIGEWRARLRSTYIRWALAINGLEVSANRYGSPDWPKSKGFVVTSVRPSGKGFDKDGRIHCEPQVIAQWDGPTAAEAHRKTMPMLAAFGVIDLYSNFEEMIFSFYRIYLNHHPDHLIEGPDFRELRRLRREAGSDPAKQQAWNEAWEKRLAGWQKNKIYDGLGSVFKAFCGHAGLKTPSRYKQSTIETWAESIEIISKVRNCLVHGAVATPKDLANLCNKPWAMGFDFEEEKPIVVRLQHLQGVDLFGEQLLTAMNLSMLECLKGDLP